MQGDLVGVETPWPVIADPERVIFRRGIDEVEVEVALERGRGTLTHRVRPWNAGSDVWDWSHNWKENGRRINEGERY